MVSVIGPRWIKRQDVHSFEIDEMLEDLMRKIYQKYPPAQLPYENGYSKFEHKGFNLVFSEGGKVFYYLHTIKNPEFHLFNCRFAGQSFLDKEDKIIVQDLSLLSEIEIKPLDLKIELNSSREVFVEMPGKIPQKYEDCFYKHCIESKILRYSNFRKECFGTFWYKKHKKECQDDKKSDIMYLTSASARAPYNLKKYNERIRKEGKKFLPLKERKKLTISLWDTQKKAKAWIEKNVISEF